VQDLVDHYADYYAEPIRHWRALGAIAKAQNVMRLWTGPPPKRVADVGCGEGSVLEQLALAGFGDEFVGYEVSPSALEMAESLTYARPVRFQRFDGHSIPADDGEFDLAVLSHVLEHVAGPRALLAEAARVARHVFVEVPLELNLRTPKHFRWTKLGHVNLFNPLLLRHLCESSGLQVLAEQVTCPSRKAFAYQSGVAGSLKWAVKRGLLLAPPVATRVFTYHGSVLAAPERPSGSDTLPA
jgi:SAM-dependent methyltransferase